MSSSPKQPLLQPDHLPDIPTSAYAAARHAQLLERLRRWLETSPLWTDLRAWFLTQPERWRGWPTASRLATLALSAGLTVGVVGQPVVALAQEPLPVGSEFQVHTYTSGIQSTSSVAMDVSGNFVVVWRDGGARDGSLDGIYAQRFNASGTSLGSEFPVNSYTSYDQTFPDIAMDADGDFVMVWTSGNSSDGFLGQDGSDFGIYAQRYQADGSPLGSEFRVNTYTTGNQWSPAVAMDTDGDFVVVWSSGDYYGTGQDGSYYGVYGQRYQADGTPLGGEFRINTTTADAQSGPSIAMADDGDFVVAWTSDSDYGTGQDGDQAGVFAQRFQADGTPLGNEFQVNSYTTGPQAGPSVAMEADGDFVIAWVSGQYYGTGQDGSDQGIYAQRYRADGTPLGGEFRVNTYTTGSQSGASVAIDADGDFIVTWDSGASFVDGPDGSRNGVYAQAYNANGVAQGGEFRVNSFTSGPQRAPSVATDHDGDMIIAWESGEFFITQDGSLTGIYAQRYKLSQSDGPAGDEKVYLPLVVKP